MRFLIVLACFALAACPSRADRSRPHAEPPLTEIWLWQDQIRAAKLVVEPLAPQPVGGSVITSGRITFDDLKVAHVMSPVTGRVVRIDAQPGQRVKKGDPLAVIESPDVGTTFSDLQKAHAEFVSAEKDFHRQRELFDVHAGSQRDMEAAQGNFAKTKAELQRATRKAQLLSGGRGGAGGSQSYTLRAPIAGDVIARNLNPGAEVQGQYSGGAVELFTIGELDTVWVMADLFEMDLGRVKQGTECMVKVVAYPKQTFRGVADWVSDTLDATTRTAKVRCKLDNPERALKPEMYATAALAVDRQRTLALPRSAVLQLGDQTMVFVELGSAPDGRVRYERRPISISEELGGDYLPVVRGISAGERVVTTGAVTLSGML